MLSLPDIKHKQIAWISIEPYSKTRIRMQNQNLVLEKEGKIANQTPIDKLLAVFVFGSTSLTSQIIEHCLANGVSLFLLKNNFRVVATIGAKAEGNFLLRDRQYNLSKSENLAISKALIRQKIKNQARLLYRRKMTKEIGVLKGFLDQVDQAMDNHSLLGIEGNAAKTFFSSHFKSLDWHRRLPRTKHDIPNLLLDMGYTYLFNFMDSLLRLYGFDTYKGVYHQLFFQRKSLNCDLMEPFRCIIEKAVLKAYNLNQINTADFILQDFRYSLPWNHTKPYSKLFLEAILDSKEEIFLFVQRYYRHFMRPNKYTFPEFQI